MDADTPQREVADQREEREHERQQPDADDEQLPHRESEDAELRGDLFVVQDTVIVAENLVLGFCFGRSVLMRGPFVTGLDGVIRRAADGSRS